MNKILSVFIVGWWSLQLHFISIENAKSKGLYDKFFWEGAGQVTTVK